MDLLNFATKQFSEESGILMSPPVKTSSQADATAYSLPDGCSGMHMIQAVYYNATRIYPSIPQAIMNVNGNPLGTTSTPTKWYIVVKAGTSYLCLYPTPSAAISDGIVVWYSKIADTMLYDGVCSDSTCDVPDDYSNACVDLAASYAFALKHDEESVQRFEKYYADKLRTAQAFITSMIIAGMQDRTAEADNAHPVF